MLFEDSLRYGGHAASRVIALDGGRDETPLP
jgi:hypothetical protein